MHSLSDADFERKDAAAATAFGQAGARAGLQRIIYLGGLGDDRDALSAHLRSRREVEKLLGSAGVPVTVIRAGIIVGHGGISWELTRQLVEHLPAMITPRWVATRTQPIAVDDDVRYLLGVLTRPEAAGRVFEAGGPEVLQYVTMLRRVAAIQGRPLPAMSPRPAQSQRRPAPDDDCSASPSSKAQPRRLASWPVPKPCAWPDLLLYARLSCSFVWSISLWSGCSAGWLCWCEATPSRTWRSWSSGMRSRCCGAR